MKNKLIIFVFLFVLLLFSGCGEKEITLEEKFSNVETIITKDLPTIITDDVVLIDYYEEYNASIEWDSSDNNVLSFTGNVNVNYTNTVEITLSYIITINNQIKEGNINVIVSPVDVVEVCSRFEKQFGALIIRDYDDLKVNYYDYFKIDWYSTNLEVFTNEGKYIKPQEDTPFEIKYTVSYGDFVSEEKTISLIATGRTDTEKLNEAKEWLCKEVLLDLYFTKDVILPTKYEPLNIDITWESMNPEIVSNDGKITKYVFERYTTLIAKCILPNGSTIVTDFEVIVEALDISKMSEVQILESFVSAIAREQYSGVRFGGNGADCNATYGHLYFYLNEQTKVDVDLIPESYRNRTGIKQEVKLIVCHDTGNMNYGATAAANASYVRSGYGGSSTGWHYTVGNDGVYQTVPDDEVAYQANGSATQYTTFIKTNVKAEWKKPNFTVSEDGYIMINNKKSNIVLPNLNAALANDGPLYMIGDDGYYYIAKLWYCESHGKNATQGGNANAVGIESAVDAKSDYMLTTRIFSKLVAELVIKHKLDLSRVVQHNTTSGKDCPNAMRVTNYWYTFKDQISLEIFAKTYLSEYNFKWIGSGDIDDTGRIKLGTTATSVQYKVIVSKNDVPVFANTYSTNIN